MRDHYTLTTPERVADAFAAAVQVAPDRAAWWRPRFNIAPTQPAPVVRMRGQARVVELLPWGLVMARRFGRRGTRGRTIEPIAITPIDAVLELEHYRTALARRRCLVPATGFYDWLPGEKRDTPVYCHLPDHALGAFAGLWFDERSGATTETRFTILVGASTPQLVPPRLFGAWLDPTLPGPAAVEGVREQPPPPWEIISVSRRFTHADTDDAACIEPLADGSKQLSLF